MFSETSSHTQSCSWLEDRCTKSKTRFDPNHSTQVNAATCLNTFPFFCYPQKTGLCIAGTPWPGECSQLQRQP